MKELFNNEVVLLIIAIPFFMLANILGGSLEAEIKGVFQLETFKRSMFKYGGVLLLGALIYAGGALGGKAIEEILGESLMIKELITAGLAIYGLKYAQGAIEHFTNLSNIKTNKGAINNEKFNKHNI